MSMSQIEQIQEKLKRGEHLTAELRQELMELLNELKRAIPDLEKVHRERAESVAGFAGAVTHEATRQDPHPALFRLALDGLSESVNELESEHPDLVKAVNGICTMLSNIGI